MKKENEDELSLRCHMLAVWLETEGESRPLEVTDVLGQLLSPIQNVLTHLLTPPKI